MPCKTSMHKELAQNNEVHYKVCLDSQVYSSSCFMHMKSTQSVNKFVHIVVLSNISGNRYSETGIVLV